MKFLEALFCPKTNFFDKNGKQKRNVNLKLINTILLAIIAFTMVVK